VQPSGGDEDQGRLSFRCRNAYPVPERKENSALFAKKDIERKSKNRNNVLNMAQFAVQSEKPRRLYCVLFLGIKIVFDANMSHGIYFGVSA
jgi:hypothetical protein